MLITSLLLVLHKEAIDVGSGSVPKVLKKGAAGGKKKRRPY